MENSNRKNEQPFRSKELWGHPHAWAGAKKRSNGPHKGSIVWGSTMGKTQPRLYWTKEGKTEQNLADNPAGSMGKSHTYRCK